MFTTINLLDTLFAIVLAILGGLSAYFLSKIICQKTIKSFQKSFICILLVNLLQSIGLIFSIILLYANYEVYVYTETGVNETLIVISNLQLLTILLTDIEILRVYSVLNPNITHRKLDLFRWCSIILFIIFPLCGIAMNLMAGSGELVLIGDLAIGIYGLFAVVFDNSQSLYLIFAVYRFREFKSQNQISITVITKFKELVGYIVATLLVDWLVIKTNGRELDSLWLTLHLRLMCL
jgi:hypothetical protein